MQPSAPEITALTIPPENPEEPDTEIDQPYDAAMRRWAERNLPTVAGWLDPTVAGLAPSAFVQRVATFAVPNVFADLLTTAGKNRLMHIEYETSPRKSLVPRMFNYRARIMTLYPKTRLTQHVIVWATAGYGGTTTSAMASFLTCGSSISVIEMRRSSCRIR